MKSKPANAHGGDTLFSNLLPGQEFRFPDNDVVFVASTRGWYRRKGDCSTSFRSTGSQRVYAFKNIPD